MSLLRFEMDVAFELLSRNLTQSLGELEMDTHAYIMSSTAQRHVVDRVFLDTDFQAWFAWYIIRGSDEEEELAGLRKEQYAVVAVRLAQVEIHYSVLRAMAEYKQRLRTSFTPPYFSCRLVT